MFASPLLHGHRPPVRTRPAPAAALLAGALLAGAISGALPSPANAQPVPAAEPRGTAAEILAAYVRIGRERNLALARVRLAERQADLEQLRARGALLPTLGVDARYSEFSGVVDIGEFINPAYGALNQLLGQDAFPTDVAATLPFRQETRLQLRQPIYAPAAIEQWRLARVLRKGTAARRDGAVRQLDADLRLAWLGLAGATQAVDVYAANERLLTENVRVAERLVSAGQGTPDAIYRARADLAELVQQRVGAERRRDAARRTFNLLLDRDPDTPVTVVIDSTLLAPLPATLEEALQVAQQDRAEVRQASVGVEAARLQRRIAGTAFRPTVALAADWGIQGDEYGTGPGFNVAVASVVLQWNLFNGGRDAVRREQAAVAARDAALQRRLAARQVALEVLQTHDGVTVARRAYAAALAREEAARRSFTLVARRYEEGLAPHVEFVAARAARTQAELGAVVARTTLAARRVEFLRAAALTPAEDTP